MKEEKRKRQSSERQRQRDVDRDKQSGDCNIVREEVKCLCPDKRGDERVENRGEKGRLEIRWKERREESRRERELK
jgi:hypothetical protein